MFVALDAFLGAYYTYINIGKVHELVGDVYLFTLLNIESER